ncbi:Ldh family oxidoreductase [Haloparvum alkalitolerans]|uniref:Ldh family oxidoreductase n=1 Tax=Haloparvum alkalitolerans TaxID=1042953 RepID=UPI003CFA20D8
MPRIAPARLEAGATVLLEALGTPDPAAAKVAASLVDADLCGHASHGVVRLATMYAPMVDEGTLDPAASPTVDDADPGALRVDGNRGFGQLTGRAAVDAAVEVAAERGVAAVGVKNGAHMGRIGEWAERAAAEGFALLAFVNTGLAGRTVTVPGSAERLFSTNPIAVGIPTFGATPHPVVLDIATSQVAHGKVTKRSVEGDPLPPAWTVTAEGGHVADADAFEDGAGALLPLGGRSAGHKGFGLSVVAELLAGVVGGGEVFGEGTPGSVNNAAAFVLIDPARFTSRERVREAVTTLDDYLADATLSAAIERPDAMDGDRPLLPGAPEHRTRSDREREGVPVGDRTLDALAALAADLGVADEFRLG